MPEDHDGINDRSDNKPATTGRTPPVVATLSLDPVQEELYAKRERIYPREVHGVFARWRVIMVALTLGVYYGLPWINWGAGRQAFLVDLPGRKFNLFVWTFWPQDLFYLAAVLIISALSLFLFTAIAGRVWCGYTCPQTVWTEVFLWIERHVEGDRLSQIRLARSPWNLKKLLTKFTKHAIWILFAAWTGLTFVGYFTPIRELSSSVTHLTLGSWELFWIGFYGLATYANAGFLREQVCLYMCPYARFQGVMFDRDTMIISYDKRRGDPRGARKKSDDYRLKGLGDCVDCTLCVQVCPTGIDIRDGLQVGCIACGACIDVCDGVMTKMGYPRGLIRYSTQNEMEDGQPRRIFRPRVIVYSAVLSCIAAALVIAVLLRVPLALDVIRDRNSLYRETSNGMIENVYTLKILNMDTHPHRYALSANGIDGLRLTMDNQQINAAAGEVVEVPVRLQADPDKLAHRSTKVHFVLRATDKEGMQTMEEARFLGPEVR